MALAVLAVLERLFCVAFELVVLPSATARFLLLVSVLPGVPVALCDAVQ